MHHIDLTKSEVMWGTKKSIARQFTHLISKLLLIINNELFVRYSMLIHKKVMCLDIKSKIIGCV